MQRRHFLLTAAIAGSSLTLTGCGFTLRGTQNYPFKSVFLDAPPQSPLALQLQRTLEASGITVLRAPTTPDMAQSQLSILQETHERAIVSQSPTGAVRELQLRLRVIYRLRLNQADPGQIVELSQTRDLSYDETYAIAKEAEEQMLFQDMQTDLVGQIIRRLSAS